MRGDITWAPTDESAAERPAAMEAQTHCEAVIAALVRRGLVSPPPSQQDERPH
ncbi:hypothetical protein [Streptomyces sp. NPDC048361]|uniref:hypothetical protein n=1 Tax=Streptomyces sp. NPDC048361 TaxID=3154720 RepID=UPI003449E1D6